MSAPTQAPAESSRAAPAQAGAGPSAADRAQLREEYATLGKKMRRWLLSGGALLLALPLLWGLLPAARQLVPTPTRGYRWRQAGTVQDSATTWVWALADSAGQAQLLLSRTQGRTWLTRRLGVPAAQARALALGWGGPWRGVLLGEKGELRLLPNALREPQRGQALTSPTTTAVALAVDTQGQRIVLKGSTIWQSSNAGRSWDAWQPDLPGTTELGNHAVLNGAGRVLFEPTQQRFFVVAPYGILQQVSANGAAWKLLPNVPSAADSVLYAGAAEEGRLLIIYHDGSAIRLSSADQATDRALVKLQVFTSLAPKPVALVHWHVAPPEADSTQTAATVADLDSALVFGQGTAGGSIQRLRLADKRIASSQVPAQPKPPTSTSAPKPLPALPAQQKPPTSTSTPKPLATPRPAPKRQPRLDNKAARAALVARAQAAVKDSAFRSQKQTRPAKDPDNPAATPTQSPVQQTSPAQFPLDKTKN